MHAVGQPPWGGPEGTCLHYLKEAHIPYSRLHDVGGMLGGSVYVDVPNIFRDFDADPESADSYDFAFTDALLSKLVENNVEPYFRLGVTIENYPYVKRYRIFPPKDFRKWAVVCEHIVRHYNEGWANGFSFGITYWEIWNEPESNISEPEKSMMWYGTAQQYYELYETAAKHLKACFGDSIKVGGYACCGFHPVLANPAAYGMPADRKKETPAYYLSKQYLDFMTFFHGFLAHIRKSDAPLDFFSWHTYLDVEDALFQAAFCEKTLEEYGFSGVEIHLNEWNNAASLAYRGTSFASARAAAMMIAMQTQTRQDMLCYYDARLGPSVYGGLFNPLNYKPLCTYYAFKAFGELYALGNSVECVCDGEGVYALAAVSGDGKKKAVLLANTGEDIRVETALEDGMKAYRIDETHFMTEDDAWKTEPVLGKDGVVLIKNFEEV